jgi:hypothetical protein
MASQYRHMPLTQSELASVPSHSSLQFPYTATIVVMREAPLMNMRPAPPPDAHQGTLDRNQISVRRRGGLNIQES